MTNVTDDRRKHDLTRRLQFVPKLQLYSSINTSNMHLYNHNKQITKYDTAEDILEEFYKIRLDIYNKRKDRHIKFLNNQLLILINKKKFLDQCMNQDIKLFDIENKKFRSEKDILTDVTNRGFPKLSSNIDATGEELTYHYISDMNIFSITEENVTELHKINRVGVIGK